ncbi:MAG: hypothetical protein K9W44_14225 [Candidatus Lokiarchaeota archaeon]|nr:hypothetical protein [Candidatus Harpocratesius repetitus]
MKRSKNKTFEELLQGERPSSAQTKTVERIIQDLFKISIPSTVEIYGAFFRINNIVQLVEIIINIIKIPIGRMLANVPFLNEQHAHILPHIPILVMYWYARNWLQPYSANDVYIQGAEENSKKPEKWLLGYKPDENTLGIAEMMMDFGSFGFMGGSMQMFSSGGGFMNPNISLPQKYWKLLLSAGSKIANDVLSYKKYNSNRDFRNIQAEGVGLVLYWTMKGWLKFPSITDPIHKKYI